MEWKWYNINKTRSWRHWTFDFLIFLNLYLAYYIYGGENRIILWKVKVCRAYEI